ncbi:MAG: tetratricopeptide repeat-containing sensor histidine kinase [Bacteroidota bacterium]
MKNSSYDIDVENSLSEQLEERITSLNATAEKIIRSETQRAAMLAQEAYDLSKKHNYLPGQANALLNLGKANRFFSCYDKGLEQLEKALEILQIISDNAGIIGALNNIGHIYNSTGRSQEALALHFRAYNLSREIKNVLSEANSLIFIGNVHHHTGNHAESLKAQHSAYELYLAAEDITGQAFALNNMGSAHHAAGNYAKALEYYLQSFSLKESIDDHRAQATSFNNIGGIYFHLGDFTNALNYYERYHDSAQKEKDTHSQAIALEHIGSVYLSLMEFDLAQSYFQKALQLAETLGDKRQVASCLGNLGKIHLKFGEITEAYKLLMTSIQILSEIGDSDKRSEILTCVAQIFIERNDPEKGLPFAKEALKIAEAQHTRPQMYEAHLVLSQLYKRRKDFEKSLKHYEKFYDIKDELYNAEMARKAKILEVSYHLENARKESEIYRLTNLDLAEANERLTTLIEERSDLLAIVAHDLKNPLTGISLAATLLDSYNERMGPAEIKKHAQTITQTAGRMTGIISRLLESSEFDTSPAYIAFKTVSLTDVVRSSIEDYRSRATLKDISIIFKNDANHEISGDEGTLRLVIDNLLSNAIKYSPFGKKIIIQTAVQNNFVSFTIKDEGPGISEDDKARLFLKFARLSAQPTGGEDSTGLGLSIVKKFTEAMNGIVSCDSTEGNGANFTVQFPITTTENL